MRRLIRWLFCRDVYFHGVGDQHLRWRTKVRRFTAHNIALQVRRRCFLYGHVVRVQLDVWTGQGTIYVDDRIFGFVRRLN